MARGDPGGRMQAEARTGGQDMPQKVVHVVTRMDRGGSAQNTLLTAIGHDRTRYAPMVVTGPPARDEAQGGPEAWEENRRRLEEAGVPWHSVPSLRRTINPIRDLRAVIALVRVFRRERPWLVHTHTSKAGVVGRLAAWLSGVPGVVHTPHGHVFYGHFGPLSSRLFELIERVFARRTHHLIALTEAERDEYLQRRIGRAERFSVIPSGIDLARFYAKAGSRGAGPPGWPCPADAVVVGSVGWLTEVKGHRVLIEAVGRLATRHPRLHLVLIGTGPLRKAYEGLASRLGMVGKVHFLGVRPDVPDCLGAMDVFVLPSRNEGMGRALVEAMAAGRPVVATRVGGVPAVVEDRRTGLLVPPEHPDALAAALDELLRRPAWAKELGAAAREAIGARFGHEAMVRAVEAVYDQVAGQVDRHDDPVL